MSDRRQEFQDAAADAEPRIPPYVPTVVPPDPARDRRRALYRAQEHQRLVRAFDGFLRDEFLEPENETFDQGYRAGWDACHSVPVDPLCSEVGHDHLASSCRGPRPCLSCGSAVVIQADGVPAHQDPLNDRLHPAAVEDPLQHNRHYGVAGWPENGCPRIGCEQFHSGIPHDHNIKPNYGVAPGCICAEPLPDGEAVRPCPIHRDRRPRACEQCACEIVWYPSVSGGTAVHADPEVERDHVVVVQVAL